MRDLRKLQAQLRQMSEEQKHEADCPQNDDRKARRCSVPLLCTSILCGPWSCAGLVRLVQGALCILGDGACSVDLSIYRVPDGCLELTFSVGTALCSAGFG